MTFELKKGDLRAMARSLGGELVSLKDSEGLEYIWQGDPAFWAGQNPILFPIVGSLKNGRVDIGGRSYEMGRHGFARGSQFTLAERGEDFAVLGLRESEATLAQYPFPFHFRVRHQLTDAGFSTSFQVENTGTGPMPFCVGGHTAFRCPLLEGERFEDYQLVFDEAEDSDALPLTPEGLLAPGPGTPLLRGTDTIPLSHEPFDRLDTLIFQGLRSKGVRLVHRDTGRGVRMEFGDFPMIAFWTMAHAQAPYLCLEPWYGCAAWDDESGRFQDKPHCITLQPGEKRVLSFTVRPLRSPLAL